ncbi:Protein of unknown function [Nonlabens sp. Hel1_33_55]|uniref:DUF1569 domain-containing protein n=1 Tax=Nonlabens sp. Hel1_33_55 TaxID=1336802 RepID=UPI000875E9E0|nr:DUF1569 domain-containing protein [Nonlabens sp. Hel1_33_55]SCY17483.1 Protein of unknown function [Nonlabens sp. Hel1_33_55]
MKNPLQKQFDQLESYFEKGDLVAPSVSAQGIYWHVDHSLRILEGVPEMMRQSKPEDYKPKSSLIKFVIMNTGWMPRGKGKSPKHVLPEDHLLDKEHIARRMDHAFHQINTIKDLDDDSFMRHPLFGSLNKKETVKFLTIHTNHHLKIMRDIVNKKVS